MSTTMKKYTLRNIGHVGAEPVPSFAFEATDRVRAVSKAKVWARYHSFRYGDDCDVIAYDASHEPVGLHNEYM